MISGAPGPLRRPSSRRTRRVGQAPRHLNRGVDEAPRGELHGEAEQRANLSPRHRPPPVRPAGGQRQRVAIARALANEPDIRLADEPTGNLDSQTGDEIVSLLEQLNQAGQTIVMVTHNMAIAGRAKRILHMRDGRLSDSAPTD